MNDTFNLCGHTALVTGSSRGIGKEIALTLGMHGAHIFFHGTKPTKAMEETLSKAQKRNISCEAVYGDIGNSSQNAILVKNTRNVDILVLNASVQSYGHISDFDDTEFDRMLHTNLRSSFQLIKAFAPLMQPKGWGRIIVIGSVNQAHPAPRLAIYASSKAACRALVLTAAKEYAPYGITVNTITPGVIATDRNSEVLSNKNFSDNLQKTIPLNRFGKAEDCSGAALLLASDRGSYITGSDIIIDGGLSL